MVILKVTTPHLHEGTFTFTPGRIQRNYQFTIIVFYKIYQSFTKLFTKKKYPFLKILRFRLFLMAELLISRRFLPT